MLDYPQLLLNKKINKLLFFLFHLYFIKIIKIYLKSKK